MVEVEKRVSRVLIADDDQVLSDLLAEYLRSQEMQVVQVYDGHAAVRGVSDGSFDIVILDVMMPRMDGFEALREIRTSSTVPVLMLTARGEDVDRIVGLEMGADDYLPKPCNPRELLARIRAILRRADPVDPVISKEVLRVDDVSLSTADRSVTTATGEVVLTTTEFNMLEALLRNAGSIVSKEELTEKGLSRKLELYDRSVDMHISNLRRKLNDTTGENQRIKTVRGIGYLYVANKSAVESV